MSGTLVTPPMLGIIGGSSLLNSSYFSSAEQRVVQTSFGKALLYFGNGFVFCQRHHADPDKEYSQPHLINKKAILSAFQSSGVTRVIAFGSVGSLKPDIPVGTLVLPDDFFNLWEQTSFFEDNRSHLVPSLAGPFRDEVLDVLRKADFSPVTTATYVQTTGPRFETKAEIRFLAQHSDVVGMTCAHEATLAAELQLPYALVCMVDNYANGINPLVELSLEQFRAGVALNLQTVERVLGLLLAKFVVTSP
eukprot:TRINITY_DN11911_c0_g1_i1.p1 TRINITY_DN11911_c0_g1~~TRINITY_DN11911_c0_g1_i1.p1  ORF type:complete len:261 (+),score=40.14 TRINITY_DN11911_c0_g1_i1:37-783(+)